MLVLDQSHEGIGKTIDNSIVIVDDVVDCGVVQDEDIFTHFDSLPNRSFGEDWVPCEYVGHQTVSKSFVMSILSSTVIVMFINYDTYTLIRTLDMMLTLVFRQILLI